MKNNFKTYNEFLEYLNQNGVFYYDCISDINISGSDYIYIEENVYGYSGGNCWGGEATHYENSSPTYDVFYQFLELFYTGDELELKKEDILTIIRSDCRDNYEYYGNSSHYEYLYLDLKEFYEKFMDIKIIRKNKLNKIGLE